MKTFGLNKIRSPGELQIPGSRLARVHQSLRRRLDDDVEEIFSRACASNDLESAADLLTLLEKWHLRRAGESGRERRILGSHLQRARRELDRQTSLRGRTILSASDEQLTPRNKKFGQRK